MIIYPYKKGSRGAKALKEGIKHEGAREVVVLNKAPRNPKSLIINWGSSEFGYQTASYPFILNTPLVVGDMTNKRRFFKRVGHSDLVPQWTSDPLEAFNWNAKLMARTILEGSGGKGIVVWDPELNSDVEFPKSAPLYTRYENKTHEFRLHLGRAFYGEEFAPFLIQRKIFQKTAERPAPQNWDVRNHANGFVYVRESGYPTPRIVIDTARTFMDKHFPQMHFVALDVIFHEKKNRAWVLEGNTAPGLEGNTVKSYVEYFKMIEQELT